MLILISNDDGYLSPGINALAREMRKHGRVVIVAPMWEQSGTSHSLTLSRPLRAKKISRDIYAVSGTPTDAVMIAVYCILKRKPDILISGINHGPNMGDDVTYSGTVAAAMEGTLLEIPSIAISQVTSNHFYTRDARRFDKAARFAAKMAKGVLKNGLPPGHLLNVNVPEGKKVDIRRYSITRLGKREYHDVITEKIDPRGEPYYWIAGHYTVTDKGPDTDYTAISGNLISVTPLNIDLTASRFYDEIKSWKL
ncbi:MAG: 5'/3'-nucleotidase SurE [candidate division Zixibacteria bacterium]